MLLAIDTSTALAGVALHGVDGPIASMSWRAGRMHTVQLLPVVETLLLQAGGRPASLTGIGVATGPGSFTGVRVGLATAKGIAASLGIPLIGINTLYYTAWPHRYLGLPIRACLPLGRKRLAVAACFPSGSGLELRWMKNLSPEEVVEPDVWPLLFCGELDAELRELLPVNPAVIVLDPLLAARNPAVLAELAWERLLQGEIDAAESLQAEYLDSK